MYDLVAASLKEKMNVASTLDSIMSKSCIHVATSFLYLIINLFPLLVLLMHVLCMCIVLCNNYFACVS